ncbi:MAG TPA: hypothetical protein VGM41_15550, partial [Chitinophagaceae bacterium]
DVPEGTYDLVISSIGFETQVYTYTAAQLPLRLQVRLGPKVEVLQDVVVEPDEKNGWEKWGFFFTQNFLGSNEAGRSCKIKNYKTLRFRHSKKNGGMLHVLADDPLVIENKVLGYQLKYQLEDFRYNFQTHVLIFYGFTLFTELDKNGPSKKQLKNREKAYNGSISHFMRSLYHDSLEAEGFEVRRMVKRPNLEKQRVRSLYMHSIKRDSTGATDNHTAPSRPVINFGPPAGTSSDSATYYRHVLGEPDWLDEYAQATLNADSLLLNRDSLIRKLFFENYLYVIYKKGKEDQDYLDFNHESRPAYFPRSNIFLSTRQPITVESTGNYYPPQTLMSIGYWAWNEKVGIMLPLDYKK